jgi:hypothetical protein
MSWKTRSQCFKGHFNEVNVWSLIITKCFVWCPIIAIFSSVSESGYLTSDIVFVSEYLNHIFMMSISNRILSDIFILSVFESESGHKYENKYDISDIRPYSENHATEVASNQTRVNWDRPGSSLPRFGPARTWVDRALQKGQLFTKKKNLRLSLIQNIFYFLCFQL